MLGSGLGLWRNPVQTFMEGWRQFGDVVRFRLGGPFAAHLLVHPDHVKHVLQDRRRDYPKLPRFSGKFRALVGDGILRSEGDLWVRQRRLMQPAFREQRLAMLGPAMTDATAVMLARWQVLAERGQAFDVSVEMARLTRSVVIKAIFGPNVSGAADSVGRALADGIEQMHRLMAYFALPERLPVPSNRRFREVLGTLDGIVSPIIAERRRSPADRGDLLSLLAQARDAETGRGMSERQLRDAVMTLFLAGHETTATALAWTWYLLSKHPNVARRLRAELAEVLGERVPTVDDLPNLQYTSWVIQEAMRLYPPAWGMARRALVDDEIGGFRIPVGTPVFLVQYLTHRHPAFWENPEGFDPERFSPERSADRPRYAYFPFGGGPRQCIGSAFGMMEAQLVLAMVAQSYQLDLVPGHPIAFRRAINLRPRHGILMTLEKL